MSALKLTLQSFFSVPKFLQLGKILVQHENLGHAHHWRVHVGATGPGHGTAGHKDKLFYVFSLIFTDFTKSFFPPLWFFLFFNFRWTSLAVNLSCWELSKARALVVISRICWEEGPSLDKNESRDPKVYGEQWSVGATGKMSLMGFSRQL